MNTLILELLYEWELGEPTAVKAVDNWGVPMRAPELAEMEYRREYTDRAAEVIPQWAEEYAAGSYGGFYVDDRAGGTIYVGFVGSQEAQHVLVEALKQDPRLLNAAAIHEYPTPPTTSVQSLETLASAVAGAIATEPSIARLTTSAHVAPEGNLIDVGATNPAAVTEFLNGRFGAGAPISVEPQQANLNSASRYANSGPLVAGSALVGESAVIPGRLSACTAGYSAKAPVGEERGQTQYRYFVLAAGHCFKPNTEVAREPRKFGIGGGIGSVRRNSFLARSIYPVDGEAIWIDEDLRSHSVLNGQPLEAQPIQGTERPHDREWVCWSGIYGGNQCGRVLWHGSTFIEGIAEHVYLAKGLNIQGDSGGPVWNPETHKAVGLITAVSGEAGGKCWITDYNAHACTRMLFTPLLAAGESAGIGPELGVEVLHQGG